MRHSFVKSISLPRSAHEVFAWHEEPDALEKLIPPGDPVKVIERVPGTQGPIGDGARVTLLVGVWPLRIRWIAVHEGYIRDRQFIDVQVHGPFACWRHTHTIVPTGEGTSVLTDHVEYSLPLAFLGDAVAHRFVRSRIERMFSWRHRVTVSELSKGL